MEALTAEPDASLREIAAIVGSSPETVRTMRRGCWQTRVSRGPICADRDLPSIPHVDSCRPPKSSASDVVTIDAAILSSPRGDEFAEWFANTKISSEWPAFATSLPLSRVYVIADEALRQALGSGRNLLERSIRGSDVPALEPPSVGSKSTIRNRFGTHDASQNMRSNLQVKTPYHVSNWANVTFMELAHDHLHLFKRGGLGRRISTRFRIVRHTDSKMIAPDASLANTNS